MLFRGIVIAIVAAFAVFVFGLSKVLAAAGIAPVLQWLVIGMVGAVALVAVVALGLGARWRAQSEAQLSPLLEGLAHSDVGMLLTDDDGYVLYVNPAFLEIFGLDASDDMIAALEARLRFLGKPAEAVTAMRTAIAQGIGDVAELAVEDGDGVPGQVRLRARPLPGGGAVWSAEELAGGAQVPALEARAPVSPILTREEADGMIERLPVGVVGLGEDGHVLYMNRRMAAWIGGEPGEFTHGRLVLTDLLIGESVTGEVKLRVRGGEPFKCFLVHSLNGEDDGPIRSLAVAFPDPMPAHEWEHALADSERKVRWLFDESPVAIVMADLDGSVTLANRAFVEVAGRRREEIVGRSVLELVVAEDRDDIARQLSKMTLGMAAGGQLEARLAGAQGIAASIHLHRMATRSGESGALLLHFIDATEQKALEEQFAQSQKMQAVGQLAGGVAHDFNNLLTAMIGFCDLLLSRHGPGDPSFADIMQIKQNANRAANLVRQLLAFSRRQTLQPKVLNITDALADMSNLLRRLIGEKIELKVRHGREIGLVKVDPGQLDQVIINLVVNARDAMKDGGTLTIATRNQVVDEPIHRGPEVMPPGDYVVAEVGDTGVGIPKENVSRIFEPFFSTKERGEGTGLGLSTVYGIVKQTGGFIFVDSEPGKGTVFTIYLPRYEGTPEEAVNARPDTAEDTVGRDLTGTGAILLVEDEDAVRTFGARALRNKGYQVIEAVNGDNALEVLDKLEEPIDLVISDVVMPGIDGPTLVRMLREQRPDLKVIFMSGYAEDTYRDELDAEAGMHFLPKPFSMKELAAKVKEVL